MIIPSARTFIDVTSIRDGKTQGVMFVRESEMLRWDLVRVTSPAVGKPPSPCEQGREKVLNLRALAQFLNVPSC